MDTIIIIVSIVVLVGIIGVLLHHFISSKKMGPTKSTQKKKKTGEPAPPKNNPSQTLPNQANIIINDIEDFYREFDNIGSNVDRIIGFLVQLDYESYNKGRLKQFLQDKNISFEQREHILNTLYEAHINKKNKENILDSISEHKKMGWDDEKIRNELISKGYSKEAVDIGFKEFHKRNIYSNYVNQLTEHVKKFLVVGKEDDEIIREFRSHGWPKEVIEEAIEKGREILEEEHSVAYLEEEILKLILEGENREHIAKTLKKRGWPEDELREHYEDIKKGLKDLEESLKNIDVNEYNIKNIRDALRNKNWPEGIIDKTINNIVSKVEFHRKVQKMRNEAFSLMEKGNNSQQIRDFLAKEGWDSHTINKVINEINKKLAIEGDKEKIKAFNSHIFNKDEWHKHITESIQDFDTENESNENKTQQDISVEQRRKNNEQQMKENQNKRQDMPQKE